MSEKPKLSLGSELSPETQTRLEQLSIKAKSKTGSNLASTVDKLKTVTNPED